MDNNPKKSELLYQIIYDTSREKFSILPTLSGLMLAVLAIGVSGDLFPINGVIKSVATALLLLTILSLQIYYSETISLLIEATKKFNENLGKKHVNTALTFTTSIKYLVTGKINNELIEKDFFKRFSSQFPALALLILWIIVFVIIYEMWQS
jgi:hypothetical protein